MSYIFHFMYSLSFSFLFFLQSASSMGHYKDSHGEVSSTFYYYFSLVGIIPVFMYGEWAT